MSLTDEERRAIVLYLDASEDDIKRYLPLVEALVKKIISTINNK